MRHGLVIHPPRLRTYLHEFKQEVTFNEHGMRDRPRSLAKPEGTFRILVVGDSFMEALQVAYDDSFPSLLEAGLRAKLKRPVEVINAAVSGWGQDDQLFYLREYGLAFKPDLVLIAMTTHNDLLDNLRERFHTLEQGTLVTRPTTRMPESDFRILQLKGFFASHSHLWQLMRKVKHLGETRILAKLLNDHVTRLIHRNPDASQLARAWHLTFALLRGIQDAGGASGADTVVMLIPLRIQLHQDALDAFRAAAAMAPSDVEIDKPQLEMGRFGRRSGIEILDLLPAFRDWTRRHASLGRSSSLHLEEGHWNSVGHRLAASVVAEALASSIAGKSVGNGKQE
jgi:hypothetical protein